MSACDCEGPHAPTSIYDEVAMIRQIYGNGWGYHQIADLLRLPHRSVRDFLVAGVPDAQADFIQRGGMAR